MCFGGLEIFGIRNILHEVTRLTIEKPTEFFKRFGPKVSFTVFKIVVCLLSHNFILT